MQIRSAGSDGRPALLDDAAASGRNGQRCVLRIAQDVAVQVHIARRRVGIFHGNTAVRLADKAHGNGVVCLQGEGIALGGTDFGGPGGVIRGVGPKGPPVSAFLPVSGLGTGFAGHPVFQDGAESSTVEGRIIDGINKVAAAQRVPSRAFCTFAAIFIFFQVAGRTDIQTAPEQGFRYVMVLIRRTGFRSQGPVIPQAALHPIGLRIGFVVPADGGACLFVLVRILDMFAVFVNGIGGRTGILRPAVIGQVRNSNPALDVVVQQRTRGQVSGSGIGDGDFRAPVRRQDPAVTGAGDAPRQVDLAALGIDVFHHQPFGLGIVIHLYDVFVSAGRGVVHRLIAVIDLVHGTAFNSNLLAGVFHLLDIGLAECIRPDIRHVLAVAALEQAVHVDIRRRNVDAVPGYTPRTQVALRL